MINSDKITEGQYQEKYSLEFLGIQNYCLYFRLSVSRVLVSASAQPIATHKCNLQGRQIQVLGAIS